MMKLKVIWAGFIRSLSSTSQAVKKPRSREDKSCVSWPLKAENVSILVSYEIHITINFMVE